MSNLVLPLNKEMLWGTKLRLSKTSVSDFAENFLERSFASCPKEQKVTRVKKSIKGRMRTTNYNENKSTKLFGESVFLDYFCYGKCTAANKNQIIVFCQVFCC